MRRLTLPVVILASVAIAALLTWIALSSASFGKRASRGEAPATRAEPVARALPPFARLDVSGTAEVMLVQGTAESVSIATDGRKRGRIDAQVRDGTLFVQSTDNSRWWDMVFGGGSGRAPQVVVTFRDLTAIDAAGTVKLSAGALRADDLTISGAGGTAIRIDDLTAPYAAPRGRRRAQGRVRRPRHRPDGHDQRRRRIPGRPARQPECDRDRGRRRTGRRQRGKDAESQHLGRRKRRIHRRPAGDRAHQRRRARAQARRVMRRAPLTEA